MDNLISGQVAKKLELPLQDHPTPYLVTWIRYGDTVQIAQQCSVPLLIGKSYKGTVICDVTEMDATHILLGRPWQFDVDVVHKSCLNQYVIKVGDHKVALLALPSGDRQETREKPNLLVQLRGEFEKELEGWALVVKEIPDCV